MSARSVADIWHSRACIVHEVSDLYPDRCLRSAHWIDIPGCWEFWPCCGGVAGLDRSQAHRWRTVAWGLGLQLIFAFLVLRFNFGQRAMTWAGGVVNNMLACTQAGTKVLFGALGTPNYVARLHLRISGAAHHHLHLRILRRALSHRTDADHHSRAGVGDAEDHAHLRRGKHERGSVDLHGPDRSAADHSAVSRQGHAQRADDHHDQRHGARVGRHHGHVHRARHRGTAPSVRRHHDFAGHDPDGQDAGAGDRRAGDRRQSRHPQEREHKEENLIGAIARGTIDGGKLALNVAIMLISFLALVALLDSLLGWAAWRLAVGSGQPGADSGLRVCAGGVADRRAVARLRPIGNLLGTRMALNEVIAYIALGAQKATLAPRSFTIATFALCGFANLGSIGMQIGGIGALVPERRNDLARLGVRAMLAGTMANLISASIAGMFLG